LQLRRLRLLCSLGLLALALAAGRPARACASDSECAPPARCVISSGQIYGICVGGAEPPRDRQRDPGYDPLDPNRTAGQTCQMDTDCGAGSHCLRTAPNSIYGACVRAR
jgi:hypothetical protein